MWLFIFFFFFSSRRRHTRFDCDWSSDVCSSDLVRKERPHPGAQLRFTDTDGHRYQCFITDQNDTQIAQLERRHRLHARVEDRIQESQELGLGRLPFQALAPNQTWFELALLAQDLLAWLRSE